MEFEQILFVENLNQTVKINRRRDYKQWFAVVPCGLGQFIGENKEEVLENIKKENLRFLRLRRGKN